jgi:type VI secretion system protein VasD
MIARRTVLRVPLVAPLLALTRCGSSPPAPPVLSLTIQAGADQNPDTAGHPAPVAIRFYELAFPAAFDRADVFALIDRPAETLGADYVASDEVIVAPGEHRTITRALKPNTRFIGVIALFRAIDQASWRVDVPSASHGPTLLTLATQGTQLTVSTK